MDIPNKLPADVDIKNFHDYQNEQSIWTVFIILFTQIHISNKIKQGY